VVDAPVAGLAQVVDLDVEPPDRIGPLWAQDLPPDRLEHVDERGRVTLLARLALAALGQALQGVLAEERVKVEAGLAGSARLGGLDPDEALVGEGIEALDYVDAEVPGVRDAKCFLGGPTAREDAEAAEEALL